jgi:Arc/MetJ family transcription regulator
MRTTVILDDKLFREASQITGVHQKTSLIHMGLQSLIEMENRRRLADLGGTMPNARAGPRRRSARKTRSHHGSR